MMKFKEVNLMTKEEQMKVLAGSAPDCEEGFVWDDGVCRPELTDLNGNVIDDCHEY